MRKKLSHKGMLLEISGQLLVALRMLWRERWNALAGFCLAAVLLVIVEVLEAL